MANLFRTVDKNEKLVPTSGNYSIGRKPSKEEPYQIVFTAPYTNGIAENTGVFKKGDIIYISPIGFIGINSFEAGLDVTLKNSVETIQTALENKIDFVQTRINVV